MLGILSLLGIFIGYKILDGCNDKDDSSDHDAW